LSGLLYAAELAGLLSIGVGKSIVISGRFYELPYWVEGQKTGRTYDDAKR
jgi:hypothetical protein